MMTDLEKCRACLARLNPAALTYDEWLKVGMALQHSGASSGEWESWSAKDPKRYHPGECDRKWRGFPRRNPPVTVATIIELCREHGCLPDGLWSFDGEGYGFDFDDPLPSSKLDPRWVQAEELPGPAADFQKRDLVRYLEAMFQSEERVGLCMEAWRREGEDERWLPKKGIWDRTAGQLIEEIHKARGDIGAVIGDTHPEAGAWVRINPLDGNGCRDENVTSLRHALLEADDGDLAQQLAIIREMQLPCSAIVHSGGKSIHALVRVEAADYAEYRKRVDYLYRVAERYGLKVDSGNRNPSRLSRLPGVMRGAKPQYMISGPCGLPSWQQWVDYVEDLKDDLPDPEKLQPLLSDLPELAPVLIDGVLRKGHKLLVTGPSKAGKSFSLIEMAAAIAEGREWMGMKCTPGPVLYVNLELDRASCLHRFRDVYDALGWPRNNVDQIDIWNLRGQSVPLDRLAPKLIRRAQRRGYVAVIIDPIYKVITGDENSAEDMAKFCNQFDRIALALGCAVIYVHHHSKGNQGAKRAIDRASGSGVFGRDPDAVLDLIELELTKERRAALDNTLVREALDAFIAKSCPSGVTVDDESKTNPDAYLQAAQQAFPAHADALREVTYNAHLRAARITGWRVDGTFREFPPAPPRNIWFNWPIHHPDTWGLLIDAKAAGEEPPWMEQQRAKAEAQKSKAQEIKEELEEAIKACGGPGEATVKAVAEELGLSDDATRNRIKKHPKYAYKSGLIVKGQK